MRSFVASLMVLLLSVASFGQNTRLDANFNGIVTISDSASNPYGTFDVQEYGSVASCLAVAVEYANEVRFLKGTYTFTAPFISSRNNMTISAEPGVTFNCTGTNSVSFFDLSGNDVTLKGINFSWDTWVDDQIGVRFKGPSSASKRAKFIDCTFQVTPSVQFFLDHDDAHFMTMLVIDQVFTKWIERNFFFPQVGVLACRSIDGGGLNFINNEVSNGVDQGFPELSTFADAYGCLLTEGGEWDRIQGNKFWAIGNYTLGLEPAFCIRVDGSTTDNEEHGHCLITGNIIENVNSPAPIDLISVQWFNLSGNLIGPNFAAVNANGEAAIKVRGSNATATTLTTIVTGTKTFTFTGTNPSLSTGETFYVATTGLADPRNARTYTASAPSSGSGPWTVVTVETPTAAETAITGVAYVATTGSVGPKKSWAGTITGNDIHNSVGQNTVGNALWIEHAESILVSANNFNMQRGRSILYIDTATAMDVTVTACSFDFFENSSVNPTSVIKMPDGVANRIGFGGNSYVGEPEWLSGSVTGNYFWPYGLQEKLADGSGDVNLTPEAADTAEQLTTNLNLGG